MAFPEPVLTLAATVATGAHGLDTATFTVAGGKTPGDYEVQTGDGGAAAVTLDESGAGVSAPYGYTMPGPGTYTASLTVPVTVAWPTWSALADTDAAGFADWTAAADAVAFWSALWLDEETATTDVYVEVDEPADPWPLPRLTLSVVVSDTDTGHNQADFTLTNAKSSGITVELDPGDGTTTVHMDIGDDGTATGQKLYTHAGHHVYTATVTVPVTPRYATWETLYGALDTWGAVAYDVATWADPARDSETASCPVEVIVGNGAIWATAINDVAPPYAQVDTWTGKPDQVVEWTITRLCPDVPALDNVMIYSANSHPGAYSLEDNEAPWGVQVWYVMRLYYAGGTQEVFSSNVIVLTGPPSFGGCWITDPASGRTMRITIQDWTTRERAARQSVLEVMNRPDPIVLSDVHTWASGEIVFITSDRADLITARAILYGSRMILVRSWAGSSIETAYMAVGDVSEARLYPYDPAAWHRGITVTVQDVRPVPATAHQLRASWGDIAQYFNTWRAVDLSFPSWADVVAWNPDADFRLATPRWERAVWK